MNAQSLAWRASSSRAARSSAARGLACPAVAATVRSSARRAATAIWTDRAASPRWTCPCPCPQVDAARSASLCLGRARCPSLTVTSSRPWRGASSSTAASQAGPSYHQWPSSSVSSAQQSSPPSGDAGDRPLHEVARVLARECQRGLAVVRVAGVAPRLEVVHGAAVVVAVGAVRRVAVAVVPDQLDGRPVDRHGHRAGLGRDRAAGGRSPAPRVWSTQNARTPWSARSRSSPGA